MPSHLSQEVNTDPTACIEVTNLGAEGYVTDQELISLIQQFKAGRKPDVAVFYDGVNQSIAGGFSPGNPTEQLNYEMVKTRVQNGGDNKVALLTDSHVFRLVSLLLGNDDQEQMARSNELGGRIHHSLVAVYQEAETRSATSKSFVFLGHFFDEVREPIYVDVFHLDT
jgi:hypothetical protein